MTAAGPLARLASYNVAIHGRRRAEKEDRQYKAQLGRCKAARKLFAARFGELRLGCDSAKRDSVAKTESRAEEGAAEYTKALAQPEPN